MAKGSCILGLVTVFLALTPWTIVEGVEITDIFTVQTGANNGGCDSRLGVLDQWLSEGIQSLDTALLAIENYNTLEEVRKSMSVVFGIADVGLIYPETKTKSQTYYAVERVRKRIDLVQALFNNRESTDGDGPLYPKQFSWLFCDSTFLSLQELTTPALDKNGDQIKDKSGKVIPVNQVPRYRDALRSDSGAKAWWLGEYTDLNGYFFDSDGAGFCSIPKNHGVTVAIRPLQPTNGFSTQASILAGVVICPSAFDGSDQLDSYRDANNKLAPGTSFEEAIPKSSTLVHEVFHNIHGNEFLSGKWEKYTVFDVLDLASVQPSSAQLNPESYVFFIAHMFHLFGVAEGEEPWSIQKHWTFEVDPEKLFVAVEPE